MVTPTASSKPCFLKEVARSTLVLCHAFPQERPTGRSGTASSGSGESANAEVPSFFRESSRRLGRLFTAGAAPSLPTASWFVYQTQKCATDNRRVADHLVAGARQHLSAVPLGLLYSPVGVPKGVFAKR